MAEEIAGADHEVKEEIAQEATANVSGDVGEVTTGDSGAVDVTEEVNTGEGVSGAGVDGEGGGGGNGDTKEVTGDVEGGDVEGAGGGMEGATTAGEDTSVTDPKETTEEEGGAKEEEGVAGEVIKEQEGGAKEEEGVAGEVIKEQEGGAKEEEGGAPDKEDGQEEAEVNVEAPDVADGDKQAVEGEVGALTEAAGEDTDEEEEEFRTSIGGQSIGTTELESHPISPNATTADITATDTAPMQRVESAMTTMIDRVPVLADIAEEEEETAAQREKEREGLVERIKEAIEERDRLNSLNSQVQNEIAEYLARKKDDEKADPGRTAVDHEKKYFQCMNSLDEHQESLKMEKTCNHEKEHKMRIQRDQTMEELMAMKAGFVKYRKDHVLNVVDQRTGKKLTAKDIEDFQIAEEKKEQDIVQVRLESIKLQNKIAKLEGLIKQKEQLVGGLHLIDFEQLKINNVDLNEKIEERNDDILKLKKKVTSTVEVLTHVKEKLQFLQAENAEKKEALREVDTTVAMKRDHLTRMKRARDSLRADNLKLRQKGGLVGHTALLKDFEERQDQSKSTYERLEVLQKRQAELTVICDGLKQKIEQAKYVSRQH